MEPLSAALEGVSHRNPGAAAETPEPVTAALVAGEKALAGVLARHPATVLLATHDAGGAAYAAGFRPRVALRPSAGGAPPSPAP